MSAFKLSSRIVGIAGLASVVILAFGMRTEATGTTFALGCCDSKFDLTIDSTATYNGVLQPQSTWALKNLKPGTDKFFNLSDVKPGDRGEATISLHVSKDAWMCLDFEKLKEKENGRNEPEKLVDPSGGMAQGELADGTEFFGWFDDGDNIFEIGEVPIFGTSTDRQAATIALEKKTYALADSKTGTPFTASTTRYVGIIWCAGDLTVSTSTATIGCDGEALGNEAQTDSFSVDISFRAAASKDNKKFICTKRGTTCEWPTCRGTNCNNSINININNSGTINSTTTSSSNTGGNTSGASSTITTGTASSNASSTNILNDIRLRIGR